MMEDSLEVFGYKIEIFSYFLCNQYFMVIPNLFSYKLQRRLQHYSDWIAKVQKQLQNDSDFSQ